MNKRIAKKKYKKALETMKTSRKAGVAVVITNQICVNENGRPCDPTEKGSRIITLKRPKIQYIKSTNEI